MKLRSTAVDRIFLDAQLKGLSLGIQEPLELSSKGVKADTKALRGDMMRIGNDFKRALRKLSV